MERTIKFGFGPHPGKIYVFVGADEEGDTWYTLDNGKPVPIKEPALTGFLTNISVTRREYKGKDNYKLDVTIDCIEEVYVLRSGIDTVFSKGLVGALMQIEDFLEPIIVTASMGDENKVVFCNVYDANSREKYKYETIEGSLFPIIQDLQNRLGVYRQTSEDLKK